MSKPLFLYAQCLSCKQVWRSQTEWCEMCKTNQWIVDEWLEAEND
jgi:RNA polymerase subunit RPABC4/transcription elongation factor Spt4